MFHHIHDLVNRKLMSIEQLIKKTNCPFPFDYLINQSTIQSVISSFFGTCSTSGGVYIVSQEFMHCLEIVLIKILNE